ncbi:hypothetical protein ACI784_09995 [Geodermatophilus sp. SYSU D01186]
MDRYGLTDADRDRLVTAVRLNHDWCYDIAGTAAAGGHAGFAEYLSGGGLQRAERTRQWYVEDGDRLRAVLLRRPAGGAAAPVR